MFEKYSQEGLRLSSKREEPGKREVRRGGREMQKWSFHLERSEDNHS